MAGVRLTKGQREVVLRALDIFRSADLKAQEKRDLAEAVKRIEMAELAGPKKKAPGIGWQAAADAMVGVLGKRLVLPPSPTAEWCGRMSAKLRDWGLTVEDCVTIATNAKGWRTPSMSFETLVYKALSLLGTPSAASEPGPGPRFKPVGMEEL